MQRVIITLLIFLCVLIDITSGQYSFVNYNHTNGLPLDEVKEIVEDHHGYIWLGGPLGLSRFDGRNFTHYYRGSSTHDVAGNVVNDIQVTPSGDVVAVYDDNGISVYNHKTDSFRSKSYSDSDSLNFPRLAIFFIYIENDTSAYLGANREGLYHINLKTFESKKIPINYIPNGMHPDPNQEGSYYLTGRGLHRLDMTNLNLEKLTLQGYSGIEVKNNYVWYHGYVTFVKKYNITTGIEKKYFVESKGVIRGWTIVDQNLWIATPQGVEVIDTASAELVNVMKSGLNVQDLQGSFIYKIYKDSKNRVWIGNDGGIGLYDPSKVHFNSTSYLSNQSTDLSVLGSGDLLSLDFYGTKAYRIKEGKELEIQIKNVLSGPLEQIKYDDKSLVLFFNGIGEYNDNSNSITSFDSPFSEAKARGLIDLYIEKEKWLGIYRYKNMLVAWDKIANKQDTIKFKGEPKGIIPAGDESVLIYGANVLWKYEINTGVATEFELDRDQYNSLGLDIVKIDKIQDHHIISTRINGVFKAKIEGHRLSLIKHYIEEDGLIHNNVLTTYLDEYDNLFVQCRSNIVMMDKVNDRFFSLGGSNDVNYQVTHGLVAIDSIVYALGYQSKSIDLRNLDTSFQKLNTIIENVHINGHNKIDISTEETQLRHFENNISISFSTLEFSDPSSIQHRYRMTSDGDWVNLDPGTKSVQLMAMAAGDYNFQLAASKGDGIWTDPLEWNFSINLPFWKRWWFLLLVFAAMFFIGYTIYRMRMKQLRKINNMKVQLVELEAESLRAQMNPHFVFNALNSIKSYIIKNNKEEASDYLTTFSELIRAVLRNSTRKEISLKDEIEALSLYLQIENQRLNQKFDFNIDVAESINAASIAFPPLIIQPFVENSIWHGFTNKKTRGLLNINIHRDNSQLIIEIIDDGIGREASKKIEKSRDRKRSYGIAITETRLHNIMKQADIEIQDLHDETGKSCGTKVIIHLPFKLLENQNENDVKY